MAKISFKKQSAYFEKLQKLESEVTKGAVIERAVADGAGVVADKIRQSLDGLPSEPFRHLKKGEQFGVLSESEKKDLSEGFGLAPIMRDKNGFVHTKAGFDGYGSHPTRSYPQGVPNQLVAASVESGSSVREKRPFVRPAVNASRKEAIEAMEKSIDDDMKKIFEGG